MLVVVLICFNLLPISLGRADSKDTLKSISSPLNDTEEISEAHDSFSVSISIYKNGVIVSHNNREIYKVWSNTSELRHGKPYRRQEGLHVLVLDSSTGRLIRSTLHQTSQLSISSQLVAEVERISSGRILIFAGVPSFNREFTKDLEDLFKQLGSTFFYKLVDYEPYLFVTRSGGGGEPIYEGVRVFYPTEPSILELNIEYIEFSPLHAEIVIQSSKSDRCNGETSLSLSHRNFCDKYDGYGDFCSCNASLERYLPRYESINTSLPIISVALMGGMRLGQVVEQVHIIRQSSPTHLMPVIMTLDRENNEAEELANLLNITVKKFVNENIKSGTLSKINVMTKFSLLSAFSSFPEADYAILLEDDLKISTDFMEYFRQTAPLLSDPEELLLCVNAYNGHSYPETASDYRALIRHQGMPAYGWMITRDVAKEMEEIDSWPSQNNMKEWDLDFRVQFMGRRHILSPVINRARHMGGGGVHISGVEQERLFNRRTYNNRETVNSFNVDSVKLSRYLLDRQDGINNSHRLYFNDTFHPCVDEPFGGFDNESSFVVFIDMPTEEDEHQSLEVILKCLGGHYHGNHEHFLFSYFFSSRGKDLFIVSCPESVYCHSTRHQIESEGLYRPSPRGIAFANTVFYQRFPYSVKYRYRNHCSDPVSEFKLENITLKETTVAFDQRNPNLLQLTWS